MDIVVLLAVVTGFVWFFLYGYRRQKMQRSGCTRQTEGQVLEVRCESTSPEEPTSKIRNCRTYSYIVSYQAEGISRTVITANIRSRNPRAQAGDRVAVFYDPKRPYICYIRDFFSRGRACKREEIQ